MLFNEIGVFPKWEEQLSGEWCILADTVEDISNFLENKPSKAVISWGVFKGDDKYPFCTTELKDDKYYCHWYKFCYPVAKRYLATFALDNGQVIVLERLRQDEWKKVENRDIQKLFVCNIPEVINWHFLTYNELSKWLKAGHGKVKYVSFDDEEAYLGQYLTYPEEIGDMPVPPLYRIKRSGEDSWVLPVFVNCWEILFTNADKE